LLPFLLLHLLMLLLLLLVWSRQVLADLRVWGCSCLLPFWLLLLLPLLLLHPLLLRPLLRGWCWC